MHNQALRDLVRGAQVGNLRDFAALVQQFQDMAVGYSQVLLEDFHLAEDAAQDAFVQAFIHLKQLDAPEAFPGWFRRIVFSCCMRYRRREKDVVLSLDMALGVHCQEPLPDAVLAQRERSRLLHRALGSLDEPEKTTVMLYYIRDHTQGEIATFMGVSTTAVKKRLHSAKEKLHRRLLAMIRENGSRISPSKDQAFARKVLDRVEEIQGVPLFARGKVRDVYDLGDRLLIVATDRISAYDCIMPNGIPERGKILTEMSLFWFDKTRDIVKNHLITANVADYPQALKPYADVLDGRSMVVVKANRIDIECVARGYLSGSGWREYKASGTVCGIKLPAGLREFDRLAEPIFTPATKAETGHDENISFERMCEVVDPGLAAKLRDLTLKVYGFARDYAESRGIIIADTKFEFGLLDGEIILIDEILSPEFVSVLGQGRVRAGKVSGQL